MTTTELHNKPRYTRKEWSEYKDWYLGLHRKAQSRYSRLFFDIDFLKRSCLLPSAARTALDAGSGSSAGSVAFKNLFPECCVLAVDSGDTHQQNPAYTLSPPPSWAADFLPARVENIADEHQQGFDLILASNLPILYSEISPEENLSISGAQKIICLAGMLTENGVLLISYSRNGNPDILSDLINSLHLTMLFRSSTRITTEWENWLVLGELNAAYLQQVSDEPQSLVTKIGLRQ